MQQAMTLTYENALSRANELAAQDQWSEAEVSELKALVGGLEKAKSAGRKTEAGSFHKIGVGGVMAAPKASGPVFQEPNGAKIQAYKHGERMTPVAMEPGELGGMVRAMLLGDKLPEGVNRIRNTAGTDSSGLAYSIPSLVSGNLIELARAKSVALAAGANTIPLPGGSVTVLKQLTDPVFTWRGGIANAWNPFQVSQPTFDRVTLTLKDVGALCAISMDMLEDSVNAAGMLESILSAAMARAIDQAVLVGAGTNEPLGIHGAQGVQEITSIGSITDYADHVAAVKNVLNGNYQGDPSSLSWLSSPTVQAAFQGLVSSATDQPIQPPSWINDLRKYVSTALVEPVSPATYFDVVGDMSQVLVGVRPSGVMIDTVRSGSAVDGSGNVYDATATANYLIRCVFRMDVALTRANWLCRLTGITG